MNPHEYTYMATETTARQDPRDAEIDRLRAELAEKQAELAAWRALGRFSAEPYREMKANLAYVNSEHERLRQEHLRTVAELANVHHNAEMWYAEKLRHEATIARVRELCLAHVDGSDCAAFELVAFELAGLILRAFEPTEQNDWDTE